MFVLMSCFVIIALLLYWDTRKPKNYPPGPPWLPILGNIALLARLRKKELLYKIIADMAKPHGLLGLKIGKDRVVVGYSAQVMRELYIRDEFQGRPTGPFYQTRTWGLRRGLMLVDGDFWLEQRKFALRQLREFGFGRRDMAQMVEDESIQVMKDIKSKIENNNGALIQMDEFFGVYVLNTLWTMLAGIRYNNDGSEMKILQNLLTELFENIDMAGALFSQFPILQYIAPDASGYNYFVDIHKRIYKFLRAELEHHKATYDPNVTRDFMDAYLTELQSPDRKSSFTESQLLAVILDMFVAGSETTSKTLNFGFLYLLLNPDVQRKAQEEIDRVVGHDRMPLLSDKPQMPFMEGVVLESLRMFMIRAFAVPHRATRDTTLLGYNIPKDTMILLNYNGILSDMEAPWEFRPERFIKGDQIVIPEEYYPFGLGKHRCIGESLAKANIFMFTTSILQKYDLRIPAGTEPPSTRGIDACTPATGPFKAFLTPRRISC